MTCAMAKPLTLGALAIALCALASLPSAALELDPGEWQGTETGTENGEPAAPVTLSACIVKADSRDLVKALTAVKELAGQKCVAVDLHDTGKTLSFRIACGLPDKVSFSVDANLTFENARHYSGTIKSSVTYAGKTTSSDKQIDSRRIGPCKEK